MLCEALFELKKHHLKECEFLVQIVLGRLTDDFALSGIANHRKVSTQVCILFL